MSWELLPEDYTDRSWEGLQKYNMIQNDDDTVSFEDVTEYENLADSFFSAMDANQITTAINILMSMVESGTDIYQQFLNYFNTQKEQFEEVEGQYLDGYEADIKDWFEHIQAEIDPEAATHLQNEIEQTWAMLADAYSQAYTYDIGDRRIYRGKMYECISPVTTPGPFDPEKWTQIQIADEFDSFENKHTWVDYIILASGWDEYAQYSFENDYPSDEYDIDEILPQYSSNEEQKQAWSAANVGGRYPTNYIRASGNVPTIDIPVALNIKRRA